MVFIKKIAYVVHDCVENWLLEENGQCNKNLGHLFLLVFYIEVSRIIHYRYAIISFYCRAKLDLNGVIKLYEV